MSYKLGSLFDGSGGFPLAGSICGIEPRWASEVEPYPIAVTRERFPNMKHLGDISKINGAEVEPVDIITFGSPCQDLSVAGKRAGLKHAANGDEETTRSGLFMEAVRIIKEMRAATNGQYPRFALWENVPGAFSSNKGEDFRVVCEELIKIVEPSAFMPEVPKNGWAYADSYVGDGWSLAYRVFDAQYWGVPQRRRRIHLVADFRGECARQVLFERDGVRGYFTPSGAQRQTAAADIEGSTGATGREGEKNAIGADIYNLAVTGDRVCSLTAGGYGSTETSPKVLIPVGADLYNQTLTGDKAITIKCRGDNEHTPTVQEPMTMYWDGSQTTGTLTANNAGGNQRMPDKENFNCVIEQCAGFRTDNSAESRSIGCQVEVSPTVRPIHPPAAVYRQGGFGDYVEGEVGTLKASGGDLGGGSENLIVQKPYYIVRRLTPTECARLQGFADRWGHISRKTSLTPEEYRFWLDVRNTHARIQADADIEKAKQIIEAEEQKDQPNPEKVKEQQEIIAKAELRKERDYTEKQMLTWYNKLWTDSAEYKMWGNGIALPPALYCMQGIIDALTEAVGEKHELGADLVDDLNRQNSEAVSTVMDFITEEPVAENEGAAEGEVTDLSDAPEEIKQEILENDEKLKERSAEKMGHYEPIKNPLIIPTDEAPKSESREQRMKDEYIKILQDKAAKLEKERDTYRLLYETLLKSITEGVGA